MGYDRFEHDRLALFAKYGFSGEGKWFEDGDGKKTYAIVRDGDGVPTVLVHGGIAEASVWTLMAQHMAGSIVIPDRPGYGLTYPMNYRGIDYRNNAAGWLGGLVDAMGVEKVNLIGNSMGGFFCMAFACSQPGRVNRMVLAGAPAGLDRDVPLFIRLWGSPLLGRLISLLKMSDPEKVRERIWTDLVAHPKSIPVDLIQLGIDAASLPGVATTTRTMLGAVTTLGGWRSELMMREAMAGLTVPTLFVWGEKDSFAPPSSGLELANQMSDADVVVLEDAGHVLQIDQPEVVAQLANEFLLHGAIGT